MSSTSLPYSPILSLKLFSRTQTIKPNRNTKICIETFAMRRSEAHNHNYYNRNYSGGLVDENLIVLRKRIREMKMMEGNHKPPTEWMYWEKRFYYTSYDSIICEAMRLLQSYLMETRPSMALAMIALITLSVPTSTALAMFHLLELTKGVLSRIHLSC